MVVVVASAPLAVASAIGRGRGVPEDDVGVPHLAICSLQIANLHRRLPNAALEVPGISNLML